jgi:hypothetical protein
MLLGTLADRAVDVEGYVESWTNVAPYNAAVGYLNSVATVNVVARSAIKRSARRASMARTSLPPPAAG